MEKVFISITGPIRDTYTKFKQEYRKYYLETEIDGEEEESDNFEYGINEPIDSTDLLKHFNFHDDKELKYFMYIELVMEIFGHSSPPYNGVFNDLAELYKEKEWEITLVSDELGKGKPSTLFYLSKNSCYLDNIKFYKKGQIEELWESCDIWITSDPEILEKKPKNKKSVKVVTTYNENSDSDFKIENLWEVKTLEM